VKLAGTPTGVSTSAARNIANGAIDDATAELNRSGLQNAVTRYRPLFDHDLAQVSANIGGDSTGGPGIAAVVKALIRKIQYEESNNGGHKRSDENENGSDGLIVP
jgi:hypothetical protein